MSKPFKPETKIRLPAKQTLHRKKKKYDQYVNMLNIMIYKRCASQEHNEGSLCTSVKGHNENSLGKK